MSKVCSSCQKEKKLRERNFSTGALSLLTEMGEVAEEHARMFCDSCFYYLRECLMEIGIEQSVPLNNPSVALGSEQHPSELHSTEMTA